MPRSWLKEPSHTSLVPRMRSTQRFTSHCVMPPLRGRTPNMPSRLRLTLLGLAAFPGPRSALSLAHRARLLVSVTVGG